MEIVPYGGWEKCARLTDDTVELYVTLDVGPRVIRFGLVGGPNEFVEFPDEMGETGGKEFRLYGGHRLWMSPEDPARTYLPDNAAVTHTWDGRTLTVTAPVEKPTSTQREIAMRFEDGTVRLEHRAYNRGLWGVECAPWCLTIMAPGGEAFFPHEPYRSHSDQLLPARPLVLWAYTQMDDPRWTWGRRLVRLRQDRDATTPQKVGALVTAGWAAYLNGGRLFMKRFPYAAGTAYPDFGCNFETFTRSDMLELESLGPTQAIPPGGCAVLVERWRLFDGIALGRDEEAEAVLHECAAKVGPAE
jgi:hypothetical protein